jgi:hypothetical protein
MHLALRELAILTELGTIRTDAAALLAVAENSSRGSMRLEEKIEAERTDVVERVIIVILDEFAAFCGERGRSSSLLVVPQCAHG